MGSLLAEVLSRVIFSIDMIYHRACIRTGLYFCLCCPTDTRQAPSQSNGKYSLAGHLPHVPDSRYNAGVKHKQLDRFSRLFVSLMLVSVLVAVGCHHSQQSDDVLHAPADFTLDYAQLAGDDVGTIRGVDARSARYVVLPDGTLHAGLSQSGDVSSLPPRVRTLSDSQMDRLWQLVGDLGLDESGSSEVGNMQKVMELPGQMIDLVAITADDRIMKIGRTRSLTDAPDPRLKTLAKTLAVLAWMDDDVASMRDRTQTVERYDFGSDPYQRYRK